MNNPSIRNTYAKMGVNRADDNRIKELENRDKLNFTREKNIRFNDENKDVTYIYIYFMMQYTTLSKINKYIINEANIFKRKN